MESAPGNSQRRMGIAALALAGTVLIGLISPAPAAGVSQDAAAEITHRIEQTLHDHRIGGAALIIRRGEQEIYRHDFGDLTTASVVPLASASKWVAAGVIATLVDAGKLDLDAPIDSYVPDAPADKAKITLRQLLSHTAGFASRHALRQSTHIPIAEGAHGLLTERLRAAPGSAMAYGGESMQLAGYLAVKASGQSWLDLFHDRLAVPLGWRNAVWDHPMQRPTPDATNPNIAAGLHLSADDYIGFLDMMAHDGVYRGKRILSVEAVKAIEHDNVGTLPRLSPPSIAPAEWGYGLGCWCEVIASKGSCTRVSSPGAFGTYPWLDTTNGVYGVFVTKTRLPRVVDAMQDVIRLANTLP